MTVTYRVDAFRNTFSALSVMDPRDILKSVAGYRCACVALFHFADTGDSNRYGPGVSCVRCFVL